MAKNGINDVRVEHVRGSLTDHYDPRDRVLRLSDSVYSSTSIAALGIAAHECGHAIQDAEGYASAAHAPKRGTHCAAWFVRSRAAVCAGLAHELAALAAGGIAVFTLVVAFYLITLPVEYNASNRALAALESGGYLDWQETDGARKVLRAAGLTYVAAALQAICSCCGCC